MGFLAALGPILGAIGSAATGGGLAAGSIGGIVAGGAVVASTAATVGTSIYSAVKPGPKMPDAPATPEPAQATAAVATERKQLQQKAGYRSTLLTNQLSQYSANPGGKTLLGQ
jgi:hypothetical protein